ncbi:response regulator [Methanocella arvoryzae]|uniref:response regulator n=1 Tax=Methanocella arvoryzae TaxID=1175445 RepID=UPI0003241B4F|nr:response regulator [Methanocella arvoryzae]
MKEKVLVVEDEAIVQLDIKNRLINLGYDIVGTIAYGEEAVKKVSTDSPDIVLMDIGLKGKIDGIEAAKQIKAIHNIPIIYMTANSDYTTLQKSKITGPFGYILKPFDEREMRTTIEMALYKHKMDAELNEARHLLETTLNSISDAVVSTNSDLLITYINPAVETMTGWTAAEAAGKNIHEVIHVLDSETGREVECPAAEVLETGTTCTSKGMMTLVGRNGNRCPVDCTLSPIFGEHGKIDGVVFVFRDVSEKLEAIEAYKVSEMRLARALSLAHMGNWDWDIVKGTIWLSDESKNIFGIESDNSVFSFDLIKSMILPEDQALLMEKINLAPPELLSTTFDFRIRRPDGELRYLRDEAEFIRDASGAIIRMLGTTQDVTSRVLVEQALRESEEKFSLAFQYNPLPMSISTLEDGMIIDVNRRFTDLFGFSREETIGKTSLELGIITPEDRSRLIEQVIKTGRIITSAIHFRAKDGSTRSGTTSYDVITINGRKHLLGVFTESQPVKVH